MHEHDWALVKQQLDLGVDRMIYRCECGAKRTTEYDIIEERRLTDVTVPHKENK